MPHFIIEYTDNIKAEADIPALLKKSINRLFLMTMYSQSGDSLPGD